MTDPYHFSTPAGTPAFAIVGGTVTAAIGDADLYNAAAGGRCGNTIVIAGDDGATDSYCHLSQVSVTARQRVVAGDSFDNAMAESVVGLFKKELYRNPAALAANSGPWRGLDDLEIATCGWMSWFNDERTHGLADLPAQVGVEAEAPRAFNAPRDSPERLPLAEWSARTSPQLHRGLRPQGSRPLSRP